MSGVSRQAAGRSPPPFAASARRVVEILDSLDGVEHERPGVPEDRLEQLLLRIEVVIEQPVGDAGFSAMSPTRLVW